MNACFSGDEYYWKLVGDFIGPQSGEGLEIDGETCKNRLLIQVGLLKEDNNFPWIAITDWLRRIFPRHHSADFRCLIERGMATALSLGSDARFAFLESRVNFNFVGPICDSIGVEREHLLKMLDFSEQAQSIEVTNALILELSNFVTREKIAPVVLVTWLRNFNPEFCKDGDIQKAYKVLRSKIKKLKLYYRNSETRSHRRNAVMEKLLQTPFELVRQKHSAHRAVVKKRRRKDGARMIVKEEQKCYDIVPGEELEPNGGVRKLVWEDSAPFDDATDQDSDGDPGKPPDDRGVAMNLLDIAMLSVEKLSRAHSGENTACKELSVVLLRNQYHLTCKEHPAMAAFEEKLNSLSSRVSLASPVDFLHANANFLVDLHNAVEQHLVTFEKEITDSTGERLGRDRLPEFRSFVNLSESATSRYIHMASDILSPCTSEKQSYHKYWLAFCEEKNNPSRLGVNQSNPFESYFQSAAGLIHHHKEIAPFVSDLLSLNDNCPNVILASVTADASDSIIQSLVCVLAIVYCKILGPYWQLLTSGGEYSLFGQYILCLHQKFLEWAKDPSTLLEPEPAVNVFLQFPFQEKTFDGVFQFCGQWHTNTGLIGACLKRIVKVIATVTEEHMRDFLPGGPFSTVPSPELSLKLLSCTYSVLMAEYPFSFVEEKKKCRSASKRSSQTPATSSSSSASSEEDGDHSSGENTDVVLRRKVAVAQKVRQEQQDENMDQEYIKSTVQRNGGPCKTKTDVDKLLLRFDGRSRAERCEGIRCEILYQKMILNNPSPHLSDALQNRKQMVVKLKLALPRVRPGYSLILAPRKTKPKPVSQQTDESAAVQSEERFDTS